MITVSGGHSTSASGQFAQWCVWPYTGPNDAGPDAARNKAGVPVTCNGSALTTMTASIDGLTASDVPAFGVAALGPQPETFKYRIKAVVTGG